MAIVVLVCSLDQGLQLGHIFRVRKVDHIDGNIILSKSLAQTLVIRLIFFKGVATENYDARLGILVHSVLKGELGNLHCSHEIPFTIYTSANRQTFFG